jgi:hypothetical protein
MLRQLVAEVAARGRRRLVLRGGAAAALAAGLLLFDLAAPARAPAHGVRIELVRDDGGVMARLAPPAPPVAAGTWVDDDQLLALLASAGRATGLIRARGRVLLTVEVTDDLP